MASSIALCAALWNLFLVFMRKLQPLLVIAMVAMVAWALLSREPWPYSVAADSEHATLVLRQNVETNWRIDGSQLCVRASVTPVALPAVAEPGPCPSRRWQAFDLRALPEPVLRIPASASGLGSYTARLDVDTNGALAIQLSAADDATALQLFADAEPVEIGSDVLLHFPPPAADEPARRLLLPFVGVGTIGKDVSWREPTLLRSGVVTIYTRSQESAGGRDEVANTELLPGDRVDLSHGDSPPRTVAKGFVHFDLEADPDAPPAMRVVAFGEADAIHIVRYGERGFTFSPGVLARLSRHSAVATWGVLLFSLLGLLAVYKEGSEIGNGSLSESRGVVRDLWRELIRR